MIGFLRYAAGIGWWMAAVVVAVAPRRLWSRLEPPFPLHSAAAASGILTSCIGFAIDVRGTLNFVLLSSSSRMETMLGAELANAPFANALAQSGPALNLLSFLYFPFFTPLGLFVTYLTVSGAVRWLSAWFDDPRGDFILSGVDWAATTLLAKNRSERARLARERREGPEVADRLMTGAWAGLSAVDYVIVAARRKPEWDAGAIILTSEDWYRLGVPFDMETPAGLRTAYPLTRMETVEVVRRGIQYELPKAKGKS